MILEQFEQHIIQTDRGSSAKYYLSDLRKFQEWFKKHEIISATILDLIEYRKYLQEFGGRNKTKAKASTVNRSLTSLSIFFKWAHNQNLIQINPTNDLKTVKEEESSPKWLNRNEQAGFMRAVQSGQNLRNIVICNLMLYAGLRVSEVCALETSDIVIRERSGQIIVRSGKGNKQRTVPLNSTLRKILSSYLKEKRKHLFMSKSGGSLTPRGVQHMVDKYAYIAKLDNVTPHVLRHSFCKNLIDMGVGIEKVAALAGHSSMNVTKRYVTPSAGDLQEAVEAIAWS